VLYTSFHCLTHVRKVKGKRENKKKQEAGSRKERERES
jgi:hypothetical protein